MAVYALGIVPLIMTMIELVTTKCNNIKMIVFADDIIAARKLKSVFHWWAAITWNRTKFGYLPEPTNSWFITEFGTHVLGKEIFKNTKVKIINSGKRCLGSVSGK